MASRAELKGRAKACLKNYYWMAFLVSLVALFIGATGDPYNFNLIFKQSHSNSGTISLEGSEFFLFLIILITIAVIAFIVGVLLMTFLSNVVKVGLCSFFLEGSNTKTNAGFQRLFIGFTSGKYMKLVKSMFMMNLIIFGWSLLLIIPGIIKAYQYSQVPYILAEYPDMDYRSALKCSRDMMAGNKFRLFVLQLSFIGWEILGILACFIGILFVLPYQNATFAEFYVDVRDMAGRKEYV